MSNDVADNAQPDEPAEASLADLGRVGALARLLEERMKPVIGPKKDAAKLPLLKGFAGESKQSDLIVQIDGRPVGRYKVALTQPRFVIDPDNSAAFDEYAEQLGEVDVIVTPKPSFVTAMCKRAELDPETGDVFDSETGEIIPGLKFLPGGEPTGVVSFTWETFKKRPVGKEALLAAHQRGDLNHLLRETPELMAGPAPAVETV
ncbi:hypothetical protein ACFWCA_19660 [Streptomyces phaeochromogenes]|uniref:hypothetical protein n=1 Tax=Streptomyces phaeochromogenes TaxID=1923 RepID=UPI00367C1E90